MTEMEKLKSQMYYNTNSDEVRCCTERMKELCFDYNHTRPSDRPAREALLRQIFGSVGANPWVEAPIQCDMGERTHIGNNFYANHGCIFLDFGGVTIGDNVLLGPNVGIYTPEHAFDPELRAAGYEISRPIVIGDNVWIGGNSSIMGGVTIGSNTIIGAGSVVTHDIPDNVIAVGNPCRVLREITEVDRKTRGPQL